MRRTQITRVATVDAHLSIWLQAIKARTGLSEAEQIRRGIRLWVESFQDTAVSVLPPPGHDDDHSDRDR